MTVTREPTARTRLRFGILGPLAVTLDGDDVQLGGRRQRGVLAALLLARGHQVSAERLLDALWDGEPPPSGAASLQAYVSHLRKALEPDRQARTPSRVLVSSGAGYALPVPEEDVDAWRFEAYVGQAAGTTDPRRRVALLQEGLRLWRGQALVEYAASDWAAAEARRLDELRTLARERLLSARLDAGEADAVVPEIEALLAEEPLREERWRLLALALYRAHRQADALAALRRARDLLAEELGVDPGPALRTLEAEMLAQSPSLDAPELAPLPVPEVLLPEVPVAEHADRDGERAAGQSGRREGAAGSAPDGPWDGVDRRRSDGRQSRPLNGVEHGAMAATGPDQAGPITPGPDQAPATTGPDQSTRVTPGPDPSPAITGPSRVQAITGPDLSPAITGPDRAPAATAPADGVPGASPRRLDLVDRELEMDRLRECMDEALAGQPRVAVIEGPAGIGKSSLLHEIRQQAAAADALVLTARGSPLEKEFGFGAVRQLFEPVLAEDGAREQLLAGAAVAAARVFDTDAEPAGPRAESLFSVLHGLYWLVGNLVERQPVVLAVDDVQWCDSGSLRFLGYLARRLGGMRLLVVATMRTGEQHVDEELLTDLAADPETLALQPSPLTLAGVTDLVRDRLPGADEAFVGACFRTTAGNPLLLRQLLRALEAEHVRPDASHADTVRAIGSRAVSSLVLMRFRRMPEANREVARAAAVLGDGASLPMVAAMTGLDETETARATAALARAEVLRPDLPLGFVHPLVGDAIYDDLPLGERELLHDRAARVLAASGASPEQVAAHLLVVPARGDAGVVEVLRQAADRAVARGAADSATAYLRRALAEPPPPEDTPRLLMDLGRLETMGDGPAAMQHLAAAYRLLDDPALRADSAIMLARTAVFAGERGDAARIANAAAADLGPARDGELADQHQHLVALARVGAYMHGLVDDFDALGPVPEPRGEGPGARGLAAEIAWELLCRGVQRERAVELARFALEGRVLQAVDPGLLWVVAAVVLEMAGEDTRPLWEQELAHAYRSGGLFVALSVHLWLGYAQWHRGELRESLQSMVHCTEQNELWGAHHVGQAYTDAFMICMLLDRGDVTAAREALELARGRDRLGEGVRLFAEAEAAVQLAEGDPVAALATLESVADLMVAVANPAWRPWRTRRATVLAALGRTEEAVALAREELDAARTWGTPALVGRTLRVLGEISGDAEVLREAAVELTRGSRRFELARARLALGRVLAEEADDGTLPEEARSALLEAVALADTCSAEGLRQQAVALLGRHGVDVPSEPAEQVWLTSAELRIATMAVDGVPQSRIAQALFVTCSTVQTIVESVSARLGASSLDELRTALARL